jgi:uncharacterized protein
MTARGPAASSDARHAPRPSLSLAELGDLRAFRATLEARFGGRLERLVLFGSRARGEGHEQSDLDVLVLVRDLTKAERRAVVNLAYDVELGGGQVISPLVRDPGGPSMAAALCAEIARDGVTL